MASPDYRPQRGEPVFSIGCDHGAEPSIRESMITAINRYVGPPSLEIQGHPVEGRSGGGLFASDGRIIGICNAADTQEDRGIYAGPATIHQELKSINQERIYLADASADRHVLGGTACSRTPRVRAAGTRHGELDSARVGGRNPGSRRNRSNLHLALPRREPPGRTSAHRGSSVRGVAATSAAGIATPLRCAGESATGPGGPDCQSAAGACASAAGRPGTEQLTTGRLVSS